MNLDKRSDLMVAQQDKCCADNEPSPISFVMESLRSHESHLGYILFIFQHHTNHCIALVDKWMKKYR